MRRAYRLRRSSGRPARSHSMARAWLLLCVWGKPCQAHRNCHGCHVPERRTEVLISMHMIPSDTPQATIITKRQSCDTRKSLAGKGRRLDVKNPEPPPQCQQQLRACRRSNDEALTCANSIEERELVELRRWPKSSSEDLLASKEALSNANELLRERVVLTDSAPDCTLSMLGLCCALSGTAQATQTSHNGLLMMQSAQEQGRVQPCEQ